MKIRVTKKEIIDNAYVDLQRAQLLEIILPDFIDVGGEVIYELEKIKKIKTKAPLCNCIDWPSVQGHIVELEQDANELRYALNEIIDRLNQL